MELLPPFRKIIHVDMDAFYASVAELDNPELRGKAIAVGGSEARGVVSAASYEARKFGVKSAMSSFLAKQKCPHLIFVKSDFERYKELSLKIRAIFYKYTDLVEPLSLDEAYLDVTENKKGNPSANDIAREIRARIYTETGLRASAGISIVWTTFLDSNRVCVVHFSQFDVTFRGGFLKGSSKVPIGPLGSFQLFIHNSGLCNPALIL